MTTRPTWRTSSYSGSGGNCVEVRGMSRVVGVRDSKRRTEGTIDVSATAWKTFIRSFAR